MIMHLGIDHFGDTKNNNPAQTLRDLVTQAELADHVGLASYNLGEHHRDDYAVTAPDIVLSHMAAKTQRIKLGTAVIVLSSDDPVRLYERFSTMDALSNGRMELTVGRGSFTESFPLFGFNLSDYEELFDEKLRMLTRLWNERPVTWKGHHTQALTNQELFPPMAPGAVPLYVAVGGSPESVIRAARHNLGLRLAIIGGDPERFAPFTDLYRRARSEFGHTDTTSVGFHSHGLVARTDAEAREAFFPDYLSHTTRLSLERGWGKITRARFEHEVEHGALFVGSPETVARKLAAKVTALGVDTFNLKTGHGNQDAQLRSIELLGTEVAPLLSDMLAGS